MPDIVLTTINARYSHSSLALRCLAAHLPAGSWCIDEAVAQQSAADIVERLLSHAPRIIGIGVYIWNVEQSRDVVSLLRTVRPDIVVVLGGPEVSHALDDPQWPQPIAALADYVIQGEGELTFRTLCADILAGNVPARGILAGKAPDLATDPLPYAYYTEEDIAHRVIYVEASRGCPYKCQFCLSALDTGVRGVPLPRFLDEMEQLLQRGVTRFKFIDRTFNLKESTSLAILTFFLERLRPGLFLHFELVPDRLPASLRAVIAQFPPGCVQFEVGLQTLDPAVSARIDRRQNLSRAKDNLCFLTEQTGVHLHVDLIIGLPGETLEQFAYGFDTLVSWGPHEIQVGILKRLRGAPISRHDQRIKYADRPPYDIVQSDVLDYLTLQRLKRFAKVWDLLANSGNFTTAAPLLWSAPATEKSPFAAVLAFSDWLHAEEGRVHSLALDRLVNRLSAYLVDLVGHEADHIRSVLEDDYTRSGRTRLPRRLRKSRQAEAPTLPRRQQRHHGNRPEKSAEPLSDELS